MALRAGGGELLPLALGLGVLRELGVAEVPVSVVRLSEAREKALNVVLNNQEAQGRYDPGKLADLLAGRCRFLVHSGPPLPERDALGSGSGPL